MNDSDFLVTVLFVIVSVLLLVDIAIAVTVYTLLRKVRNVVEKAETAAENFASVSKAAKSMSVPLAIAKIVKATAERFNKEQSK